MLQCGGHLKFFVHLGLYTQALPRATARSLERNGNDTIEVRELADYVEEALPEITKKWGYEHFPFSYTEERSFTLVPRQP